MPFHSLMTRLHWQLERISGLVVAGLRSLQQRGLRSTLSHIPRRLGWGMSSDLSMLPPGRRHVLIIDAQVPDRTRDSGSVRLMEVCLLLQARGLGVAFAPHAGTADADERARLAEAGIALIGVNGSTSLPAWLARRNADIAGVMLCRHPVAAAHLPLVRQHLPQVPIAFDTVDLHYLRLERAADLQDSAQLRSQALHARQNELALASACDLTYVVSQSEAEELASACPQARVAVLSNIHHEQPVGPGPQQRDGALFIGGWGHHPNQDAIDWLTATIWPSVLRLQSGALLHLVGDIPAAEAQRLAALPGVIVHGRVADLQPLLAQCRVSVAPLRVGAGVKGKVNSAMSHGLPVVLTTIAAEGMFITNGVDALVADTAEEFSTAIVRAMRDDALWLRLREGGLRNIRQHFSAATAADALECWLAGSPAQGPVV